MNREKKKQIKMVAVAVFFLVAGVWYVLFHSGVGRKQEPEKELTGVLSTMVTEVPENTSADPSFDDGEEVPELVVYVCGAVNEPGIYTLPAKSRLYEAVAMAGGFSGEADPAYHNLARDITDGERIYILSVAETKALTTEQQVAGAEDGIYTGEKENGRINLNTATAEQLMELPGIGEVKATAILAYRANIGAFTDIEEIKNVSGIGEAMFEKIKDKIMVK